MRFARVAFACSLLLAPLGPAGCAEEPEPSPPNLVLVTIDTLRADHLAFYGYERSTMPKLEEWVDEGTLFERCYSPIPLTDPGMSSIMTGLHPLSHGIRHVNRKLEPEFTTLAEILHAEGYATAAFTSRVGLIRRSGLGRGFMVTNYIGGQAKERVPAGPRRRAEGRQRRAEDVTAAALNWLEGDAAAEEPFFLWLHYFDPHAFYDPPAEFSGRFNQGLKADPAQDLRAWWGEVEDRNALTANYDGEIATVDHYLNRFVEALRARGVWDETLFVLTADHGESLGEHGHMDHGEWLFEEQIHVPLLIRLPSSVPAGLRVRDMVSLVDLAPTVLDLLELPGDEVAVHAKEMEGASLRPLMEGGALPSRRFFFESENCPTKQIRDRMAPGMECYPPGVEGKVRAVREGRWKLIITPLKDRRVYELYDLETDPEELRDRSADEPDTVRRLEQVADAYWSGSPMAPSLDGELQDELRALGYIDE